MDSTSASRVTLLLDDARAAATPDACAAALASALGSSAAPPRDDDALPAALAGVAPEQRFALAKLWAFSRSRRQRADGVRLFEGLVAAGASRVPLLPRRASFSVSVSVSFFSQRRQAAAPAHRRRGRRRTT